MAEPSSSTVSAVVSITSPAPSSSAIEDHRICGERAEGELHALAVVQGVAMKVKVFAAVGGTPE